MSYTDIRVHNKIFKYVTDTLQSAFLILQGTINM